ncbi:hypothetical protein D3C84_760930 [compost metagenome]
MLSGQGDVAGKPRLHAAKAVRHQYIAVLGDAVQRVLVDQRRVEQTTKPVAGVGEHVVPDPGRVIGPGPDKGAIPRAGISTRAVVVVARHQNLDAVDLERHARDAGKLLCIDRDADHRGVRITQFLIPQQGVAVEEGTVLDCGTDGVGRQPGRTDVARQAAGYRKADVIGELRPAHGLASDPDVVTQLEPGAGSDLPFQPENNS